MQVPMVWHPKYHNEASGSLLSTRKGKDVVEQALAAGLVRLVAVNGFRYQPVWADIATVHDPKYVRAVRRGRPRRLAESQGFRWSPAFADSVARIWDGHQVASRLALSAKLVLHPVSGAHHASYGVGGGFCTFNYLVGAGRALMREGLVNRVAVLDLDAHYGNGTAAMTRRDSRFGLFDISSWGRDREAYGSKVFLGAGNASEYFVGLFELPRFLDRFQPDLVFYQAGMDCFEGDYMGAVRGLNEEALAARDEYVLAALYRRGIPTVVNLAGGYLDDGTTVRLHLQTIQIMGDVLTQKAA